MTTIEYLSQIEKLKKQITRRQLELEEYVILVHGISAVGISERVKSSGSGDRICNDIVRIDEMTKEYLNLIDDYKTKKDTIIEQIESIPGNARSDVLYQRYVDRLKFEQIAINVNYSYKQTRRIHNRALTDFEKKYGYIYTDKDNI